MEGAQWGGAEVLGGAGEPAAAERAHPPLPSSTRPFLRPPANQGWDGSEPVDGWPPEGPAVLPPGQEDFPRWSLAPEPTSSERVGETGKLVAEV